MKFMKVVRQVIAAVLIVGALVAAVAMYITYPYSSIIKWRLESAGVSDVVREADSLLRKYPPSEDGYSIVEAGELPPYISELEPYNAIVAPEGVYIRCGSFYSRDWGVFISAPDLSTDVMPEGGSTFEEISDRVFLYEPKSWKYR